MARFPRLRQIMARGKKIWVVAVFGIFAVFAATMIVVMVSIAPPSPETGRLSEPEDRD